MRKVNFNLVHYLYLSHTHTDTIVNAVVALASVEIFRDLKAGFCKIWICLQVRAIARLTETHKVQILISSG